MRRSILALAAVAGLVAGQHGARAQSAVVYGAPASPLHEPLRTRLQSERWLERMQTVVSHIRLPRPVTLKMESCGEVDAWYERRTLAVCYEYLMVVTRRIEGGTLPAWVSADEALAGAFVDAVLHEYAHAIFEQHRIPLLGREEEAADQLAAFLVLELGGDAAPGLVRGTAQLYLSWMSFFQSRPARQLRSGGSEREARAHPTATQRLYNLVCLALGSDKKAFAELASAVDLPSTRAEDCESEYSQIARAYRALIRPHVVAGREAEARRALRSFVQR